MTQKIGDISQAYSALSAEVSPVKQFIQEETSIDREQSKPVSGQMELQPDRYKDYMQISSYIPGETGNCNCGSCPRCLGKFADENYSPDGKTNGKKSEKDQPVSKKELSEKDQDEIKKLQARDREVRAHEQAHVNAGAKNAQYEYETGKDGKKYAVGGHAEIETSKGNSPEENIRKAQQIKRAALAPSNPSSQDKKVAAEAQAMEAEAIRELAQKRNQKIDKNTDFTNIDDLSKVKPANNGENNSDDKSTETTTDDSLGISTSTISQLKEMIQNYSKLSSLHMLNKPSDSGKLFSVFG